MQNSNSGKVIILIYVLLSVTSCKDEVKLISKADLENELRAAESAFSDSSAAKGFYHAMLDVAAEDVVMFNSGDTVLKDIGFIKSLVASFPPGQKPRSTLTWKPDKIEVSSSGDLGYTYGWYKLLSKDSTGKETVSKGLYSTIWRKTNGKWRLVMD